MWLCLLQFVSLSEDKMPVDWNSEDMRNWMRTTQKEQQEYYDCPNIKGRECNLSNLNEIVGDLFDFLEKEQVEKFKNKHFKNKIKIIGIIKKCIKKYKEEEYIYVSVLFVLAKAGDHYIKLPVIKLLIYAKNIQKYINIFIDLFCRVYRNWRDYLQNNTLPNCIMCYPKNGEYLVVNDILEVEYSVSAVGKRGRKFLRCLDIGSTVQGVAATGVGIAAMCFPVTSPVVAG